MGPGVWRRATRRSSPFLPAQVAAFHVHLASSPHRTKMKPFYFEGHARRDVFGGVRVCGELLVADVSDV